MADALDNPLLLWPVEFPIKSHSTSDWALQKLFCLVPFCTTDKAFFPVVTLRTMLRLVVSHMVHVKKKQHWLQVNDTHIVKAEQHHPLLSTYYILVLLLCDKEKIAPFVLLPLFPSVPLPRSLLKSWLACFLRFSPFLFPSVSANFRSGYIFNRLLFLQLLQ